MITRDDIRATYETIGPYIRRTPVVRLDLGDLDQAAEQAEEFARHGYRLALIGRRAGLTDALARYGLGDPPSIDPASADQLRAFLNGLDG